MEENTLKEKLPKRTLWEKRFVEKAYSVIAFGKMEEKFLRQLKWNPRIEVIHNALITNSISDQEMCFWLSSSRQASWATHAGMSQSILTSM